MFKVTEGSWKGQTGEFVREELGKAVEEVEGVAQEVEKVVAVVLRMAGNRLVEFKPEHVDKVVPSDPEADAKAEFSGHLAPGAFGVSEPTK